MQPFFNDNGIVLKDDLYCNEKKAIKVNYDDARQMYTLSVADIEDGNVSEFNEINAWLFDDSQNARDAVAVGIDFVTSLRKEFGIKRQRAVANVVDLPTATKDGSANISSFTKKVLDVFPALKDEYKNHVNTYGNFLYLSFFAEHLVPRVIRLFEEGTTKQVKKFYEILTPAYTKGDKDTVNAIIAVLAAAAYKNDKVTEGIKNMLNEDKHFLASFEMFIPVFAKNTKLKSILVKE